MERQYNHDRKAFLIIDEGVEMVEVPFPYSDLNRGGHVFDVANAANYSLSIYYKKDVPELDYHQVKVTTGPRGGQPRRFGWMIPIAALTTEDADSLIKPHLNEFVFWSYCHLLNDEDIQNRLIDEEISFSQALNEKYPDGNLLVIETGQMPAAKTEKSYELSLARHGYYKSPSNYKNPLITIGLDETIKLLPAGEILKADDNYVNPYIGEFLTQHAYDPNSFIRFFYLYQIVEVLLDAEMVELLRDFANKLEQNLATYQVADKALQKNTESMRFERIVRNSGIKAVDYTVLNTTCNTFLGSSPTNQLKNPECIYQVRNHIVHRFRKAATDRVTVKAICDNLELYLYDLLIKYKLPDANRIAP